MNTTENSDLTLINRAIQKLPHEIRDDLIGVAWLKLQELRDLPEDEQIKKIAMHVENSWKRKERPEGEDQAEEMRSRDFVSLNSDRRRELMGFATKEKTPQEQQDILDQIKDERLRIIAEMAIAGFSQKEISIAYGCNQATISRKIYEIRKLVA